MDSILKYNIQSINLSNLIDYAYSLKKSEFGEVGRKSSVNGFQSNEIYNSDDNVIPLFSEISNIISAIGSTSIISLDDLLVHPKIMNWIKKNKSN